MNLEAQIKNLKTFGLVYFEQYQEANAKGSSFVPEMFLLMASKKASLIREKVSL